MATDDRPIENQPDDGGRHRPRTVRHLPRVPPHNLEAEESLLGAMLLSREAILSAVEAQLGSGDFYKPSHGHIFEAITGLWGKGEPADQVTVAEELNRRQLLESVGGQPALVALDSNTPAIGNASRYARIVADHATMRRLQGAAQRIGEIAASMPDDVAEALDQAEQEVYSLRTTPRDPLQGDIRGQVNEFLDHILARAEAGSVVQRSTGFIDLDRQIGGLDEPRLIVVMGRPGMGKTDVGCNIAAEVSRLEPVLFASIEMNRREMINRLVAASAFLDRSMLQQGKVQDWDRVTKAAAKVSELKLDIRDDSTVTLLSLRAAARRVSSREKLGLVVVDYVQLMTGRERENRQVEVAELFRGLKLLSKDLAVPVICLAQVKREIDNRANKRPQLSDLRETGAAEQDADVVIGVFREDYYEPNAASGVAELLVLKQRNGPTGIVRVAANLESGRWTNLAREVI